MAPSRRPPTTTCRSSIGYFAHPAIGHCSLASAAFSGHTNSYFLPCSWIR